MSLANLLSAEQIIPEMKATERWAAIVELIDLLVGLGKIKSTDRDPILAALKQREETMSTGIGFGIAIPHCSSDRLEEVVAAFGRSTTPPRCSPMTSKDVYDRLSRAGDRLKRTTIRSAYGVSELSCRHYRATRALLRLRKREG